MKAVLLFITTLLLVQSSVGQTNSLTLTTLNCYWFFNLGEGDISGNAPRTEAEYDQKAGHLVGLLPSEAPLFVGFQEIGNARDVDRLAYGASQRYKRQYVSLFVQGKDSATKQDVAAILDTSRGWGVYGKPSRVSDLEKEVSKHLVVRLTNATTHMDICVVHLRVPRDEAGKAKQTDQNRALLRWTMRHLAKDPKANLVILGDFNEGGKPRTMEQSIAVLFSARPPMMDAFEFLQDKAVTHAGGGAYDRILLSNGIIKGESGLRFESVSIGRHSRGKGNDRRLYTDHFPVTVRLTPLLQP